jgi:hypothetical protein
VEPALDIGETFAGGDVIDDDDAVCAAVVGGRDCPEPLLTCTKGEHFSVETSVTDPELFRKGGSESGKSSSSTGTQQCSISVTFWYESGSTDPYL